LKTSHCHIVMVPDDCQLHCKWDTVPRNNFGDGFPLSRNQLAAAVRKQWSAGLKLKELQTTTTELQTTATFVLQKINELKNIVEKYQ